MSGKTAKSLDCLLYTSAFPQLKITLLDSLNKRVGFLNEVIEALELKNIEAVHGSAEDFSRDKEHRAAYDICVSRAVRCV